MSNVTNDIYTEEVVGELATAIQKNMENVGEGHKLPFGIAKDYSKALPSLGDFNITSPMVASMLESIAESSIATFVKNNKGKWVTETYTWGTTDPDDGQGCCFTPFEIQACADSAKIFSLCLKDCETTLDKMMNSALKYKSNDLLNYFQRAGMTYEASLQYIAWFSFAFRTQRVIAQGLVNYQGKGLRPFHGIAEVMSHPAVTPIQSGDILGAFAQAGCILDVLNQGTSTNYAIFVHPVGHTAISDVVVEGKNGKLPAGWERGNFGSFHGTPVTLKFKGIPIVKDIYVPKDLEVNNTFEAYIIDLSVTKVSMVYKDLLIPADKIRRGTTLEPDSDCNFVACDIYENAGVAHSANYARNILLTGMPLSANCSAGVYTRIMGALDGEVPFPMVHIPKA